MLLTNAPFAALAALAWAPTVSAYANPGACSGTCTNAHDPSIIRRQSDGTYFRFSTGGKVAIHTAPSISGPWTYKCAMLPSGSSIQLAGNQDLWAPDVSLVDNDYYVYYTVSTFSNQNSAISLATSATMDCGSFKNLGSTGVESQTGDNYNVIDGSLLKDGSSYSFNFGSFYSNLYQVDMADPPTKSSGSQRPLVFEPAGEHPEEASYMVKSATAMGGFVDAAGKSCTHGGGTVVLDSHGNVYGPGGQGVYNDPVEGWVLCYHYVDTDIGYADGQKQFGWNRITWENGWPTV